MLTGNAGYGDYGPLFEITGWLQDWRRWLSRVSPTKLSKVVAVAALLCPTTAPRISITLLSLFSSADVRVCSLARARCPLGANCPGGAAFEPVVNGSVWVSSVRVKLIPVPVLDDFVHIVASLG